MSRRMAFFIYHQLGWLTSFYNPPTSMDKLVNGSSDTANMGYYQKKLWQALNEMNEQQAEQVSKNVLGLINLNKE